MGMDVERWSADIRMQESTSVLIQGESPTRFQVGLRVFPRCCSSVLFQSRASNATAGFHHLLHPSRRTFLRNAARQRQHHKHLQCIRLVPFFSQIGWILSYGFLRRVDPSVWLGGSIFSRPANLYCTIRMALGSISCSQQPRRDETNGSMTMAWRVPKHVACRYAEERGEGRKVRVRAAPSWNPQNVPDPEVMPTVAMSARQAVSAQLLALRQVDEPRPDHGIQVMYVFANDGGGMERSRYFGYSKDIYHFDHFLGGFRNAFPELLNLQDFQIVDEMETGPGEAVVNASIVDRKGAEAGKFAFVMGKRTYGTLKDCWLTDRIERG